MEKFNSPTFKRSKEIIGRISRGIWDVYRYTLFGIIVLGEALLWTKVVCDVAEYTRYQIQFKLADSSEEKEAVIASIRRHIFDNTVHFSPDLDELLRQFEQTK